MKLSISIVSNNDPRTLPRCLKDIFNNISDKINKEVFLVINSPDKFNYKLIIERYPTVKMIVNKKRMGFSENHNMVIRRSSGKYILIMNPDVFIKPNFIERMISVLDSDKGAGIVSGKLLRPDLITIDSTGHVISRNRKVIDRGQGEADKGQYDDQEEVFSVCGAAMLCRREMLNDIKILNEYFDESMIAYKEDIDICWRARLMGWKIVYVPKSVAVHCRGWQKRDKIPMAIRMDSYKNRYLMLLRNDAIINCIVDLPFILIYELSMLLYIFMRDPLLLFAWFKIIVLLPKELKARRIILEKAVISPKEMRKWFA